MKRNPITLITSAVLLVIFVCMLFTFQVRQTEVAVVTRFGKYSRSVTNAGFQWRVEFRGDHRNFVEFQTNAVCHEPDLIFAGAHEMSSE